MCSFPTSRFTIGGRLNHSSRSLLDENDEICFMEMELVQTQTKILMKMDPQISKAVVAVAFFFFFLLLVADGVTTIAALVQCEIATTFQSC